MVELIPLMFALVTVFYIVATLAYLAFVIKPNDIVGRIGHWFVAAGFVIHLAVVLIRYFAGGYTPITNLHESFSFFALATAGAFIIFERSYRLTILGSFVMPIALVLLMASRTFPMDIGALNPALKSGWLVIHTVVAFLGYATFAIAFGAGIMYLLQEHFLKQKRFGSLYQRLPSLDTLDDINY
ncbi:MAG TPA: cytochrome c biogenesis protein CcsA, partial [Geobacterales bacterium]|nr:cytochrome c biogenesis protein CcsA [Geobacterales bacterium]